MKRKKKTTARKGRVADQKNKIRGVISSSKSRAYKPDPENRAAIFHRKLADALVEARESMGKSHADAFIQWLERQTSIQLPHLKSIPVDSELSFLASDRNPRSLADELSWAVKLLAQHSSSINEFRDLANQLEELALKGEWKHATSVLEKIELNHGKSIWWLEARIAIDQSYLGLDAQKQVVAAVRRQNKNSLAAYLGRFFSIRNEPTTTLNSFFADAADRIDRIKGQASLKSYLRFKLLWNISFSQRHLASVLVIAQGLSIVDLYETVIDIAQCAYVWNSSLELQQALEAAVDELRDINDGRLSKLEMLLGRNTSRVLLHRPYAACDLVLSGALSGVGRKCFRELQSYPRAFRTALAIAAISDSGLKHKGKSSKRWPYIVRRISALLRFGDDYSSNWLDLEKTLRNWSFSPALRACFFSLKASLSDDVEVQRECSTVSALNNVHFDVEEIALYRNNSRSILQQFVEDGRSSLSVRAFIAMAEGQELPSGLSAPFEIYLYIKAASDLALIDELEVLDNRSRSLGLRSLSVHARRARIVALVESHKISDAVLVAVDAYFSLKIPIQLLPLSGDFAAFRWKQMRHLAGNLALSIALQLSWRVTGSDLVSSNLRFAFSDFLSARGIKHVIHIADQRESWPREQLIYFLRFVCIPEVLDMSAQVESSREANEARREVCGLLIQIDPENKALYELETLQITHALSMQDGLRVLDSSRVHVDTGALTSWAVREWGPNIARYGALVEAGIGLSESLEDVFKELSAKQGSSKKFLEIPDSDADLILVDLISSLRNKFLLDPSHGLDSYLSRRVRHHSMSGNLRGAVENVNLITTKDHLTGRYVANSYWINKIDGITHAEAQLLERAFARFSDEFDRIILGLKMEVFRIKSEEHPKGIFAIPVSPAMFHLIRSAVQSSLSVEALCHVCYPIFWASLTPALSEAQATLKTATYNSISSAFHRLKAALRKIFIHAQRYAALSVAIQTASDDLNRKVVNIADWFNRREATQSNQSFLLEQALEICLEAASHSYKPFSPSISSEVEPGRTVPAIVMVQMADLILTMLGNVRQHADCGKSPKVDIVVATKGSGVLTLRMESDVSATACNSDARDRVEAIRRDICDGSYLEKVRKEGNSGLTKIASVALSTPGGRLEFGFIGNERFFVAVECEFVGSIELVVDSRLAKVS